MPEPSIRHVEIARFAADRVNLRREDAKEFREQVNRLREKLEVFIKEHPDYGLIKMLLSGSLAKGMALKDLNDIDVALYVAASSAPVDEIELLYWLADRLRKAYPNMDPGQVELGTHVVRISFHGTGLDVEVVPVHYGGLPNDCGYLVDRETGKRVLTSIPLHLAFIRARKNAQPDHFAQVVRLVKWWIKQHKDADKSFRFKSFMAELIAAHLADSGVDMSNYPVALEQFFRYLVRSRLEERIVFKDYHGLSDLPARRSDVIEIFDPVNPANNAAEGYTDHDRRGIVDAAEEALSALAEARFATTNEREIRCWQRIFGPSFRGE